MRTRVFNGLFPGPVIRMKPCGVYHLTYYNDLQDWPPGRPCDDGGNGECEPNHSGLHLHGLHVSPAPPADSQTVSVAPGESFEYIYTIPCDHAGGTHWYHTHHHGSSSMQTNGGTEGILVIEENEFVSETDIPDMIANMPEVFINLLQLDPGKLTISKGVVQDALFETTITADTYLFNGCDQMDVTLVANEWTRFRMLHVGYLSNAVMTIPEPCEGQLLALDGVYLGTVPRSIDDGVLFFTLASRVDVAIRCPAGVNVPWAIRRVDDTTSTVIGNLVTIDDGNIITPQDIPTWNPCRPGYLVDVWDVPETEPVEVRNIHARGFAINSQLFSGFENYIFEMNLGAVQEIRSTGTDIHPMHLHVSHVQLGDVSEEENLVSSAPNWYQQGDWVDTWSFPGVAHTRFRPERFVGPYLLHCHIPVHADDGMVSVINVMDNEDGTGQGSLSNPDILNWGTCWLCDTGPSNSGVTYNNTQFYIPGTIAAIYYNEGGEGIGFHNIEDQFANQSDFRRGEDGANAPECYEENTAATVTFRGADITNNQYYIGSIKGTEWLRYNVQVLKQGAYNVMFNFLNFDDRMSLRIYFDVSTCPDIGGDCESVGLLATVHNDEFSHYSSATTGIRDMYLVKQSVDLQAGERAIVICLDSDTDTRFGSFALELVDEPIPAPTPSPTPVTLDPGGDGSIPAPNPSPTPVTPDPGGDGSNGDPTGKNGTVRIEGLTTFVICVVVLTTSIAPLVL